MEVENVTKSTNCHLQVVEMIERVKEIVSYQMYS